ncbi:MAG: hypothetical protein DDT31_00516 [Syntrophomonadaceae bacterium]|nr:hypothetical protein [Bacillota bacterium]
MTIIVESRLPPVPQLVAPLVDFQGVTKEQPLKASNLRFEPSWMQWFVHLKLKVDVINASINSLTTINTNGHIPIWNSSLGRFVGGVGGGGGGLGGAATITPDVQRGVLEWRETVVATGVTPSSRVTVVLAGVNDSAENDAEMLDILGLAAIPLTGQIAVVAAFGTPTSGPIAINWSAL